MEKLWENAQVTISGSGFFDLVVETQIKKQQWEEYLDTIKVECDDSGEFHRVRLTYGNPLPVYRQLAEHVGNLLAEQPKVMDIIHKEGLAHYTPQQYTLDHYTWSHAIDLREVSKKFKDAWIEASKRGKELRDELTPKDKYIDPDYTVDLGR